MFCQFFKQGLCKKGDKCKFSHDPDVERKAVKRGVYEDKVSRLDILSLLFICTGKRKVRFLSPVFILPKEKSGAEARVEI